MLPEKKVKELTRLKGKELRRRARARAIKKLKKGVEVGNIRLTMMIK